MAGLGSQETEAFETPGRVGRGGLLPEKWWLKIGPERRAFLGVRGKSRRCRDGCPGPGMVAGCSRPFETVVAVGPLGATWRESGHVNCDLR